MEALLRLFNGIRIGKGSRKRKPDTSVLKRTIKNGYVLSPKITPTDELLKTIEKLIGISGEKANAAFHKSWRVVHDSSMEELVLQQIIHYITTYGFEALGIYREDAVYIPSEALELPDVKEDIPLVVIKAMSDDDILAGIISLGSGIALSKEVLADILGVVKDIGYSEDIVDQISNRELRELLNDYYGLAPSDPVEFLRHVVHKLTNETLLIKNDELINKIKLSDGGVLDSILEHAPDNLASIFLRYKPLFLAMKSISGNKTLFNRLRKQADRMRSPIHDYLGNVTGQIKNGELRLPELKKRLKGAGVFRKIRLAYALKYRTDPGSSIVYRVRNGRGWATDFHWDNSVDAAIALDIVLESIASSIKLNVSGKTIYIPQNVHYALPATEKQFTGNFPTGSYVSVQSDLIVGIHWEDFNGRVDLDLSTVNASGKIGWDANYRSGNRGVLFSGDVTSAPAPRGAAELFYLSNGTYEPSLLIVNYFNFMENNPVPCKIIVAQEKPGRFGNNYMVDVNNIVAQASISITRKQDVLALIINVDRESRVYFANISIGKSITSSDSKPALATREFLTSSLVNSIELRDVLLMAGAKVVDKKPKGGKYIDLSPEAIDKTTIIDVIQGSH